MADEMKTFRNEEMGIEAQVTKTSRGFLLRLFDVDAEEYYPIKKFFPEEEAAVKAAKEAI